MRRRRAVENLFVVLGNQLFPVEGLAPPPSTRFFMAEDVGLCTYVRHHKLKIALFLSAMRSYADELRGRGWEVSYQRLEDRGGGSRGAGSYEDALAAEVKACGCRRIIIHEIEDDFFARRMEAFAKERGLELRVLASPMFLTSRQEFADYLAEAERPLMASFYQRQRRRLGVLVDERGHPTGGRWSFDDENRRRLGAGVDIPPLPRPRQPTHVAEVCALVEQRFADHPGSCAEFWLPVMRAEALKWLEAFMRDRLAQFGPYEDALCGRDAVLFHSVLSPALNMGLLTPAEVVRRALAAGDAGGVPLNSLEGFIRQVVGWREFVRGIYHHFGGRQEQINFFGHQRRLGPHWYRGDTGLKPLDDCIAKALRLGWTHHIERLMVAGNLLLLCEVDPREAWRWFMEMYVDSSDWVMGPNVYGMALFSDGGVFATKPYLCGSNYLLKMSDYRRGPWCDVLDGLYWRFIDRHRAFFASQPRLAVMLGSLERMSVDRRLRIFSLAEEFIERVTLGPG